MYAVECTVGTDPVLGRASREGCSADEAVLAVGWSAGVLDDLLSLTALTDSDIVGSARTHLESNELVGRIEEAVNFMSSVRPPSGTGSGASGSPM